MERILTVSYVPGNARHISYIRIQGLWLQRAGFSHGDRVRLIVEQDRITLTKIETMTPAKSAPLRYVQKTLYEDQGFS